MPISKFSTAEKSEAVPNTLPIGANSPQKPNHSLYAEKLSGTSFIAPRHENLQRWLYRILPSAAHLPFQKRDDFNIMTPISQVPTQFRWDPFDLDEKADWLHGLKQVGGVGSPATKTGLGIYIYAAGASMSPQHAFYSSDGDLLIVPQLGDMDIQTELGHILVRPNEIVVIPRGIKFRLPELGPIGSNGLANARDFQAPVAAFEDIEEPGTWTIFTKYDNQIFSAEQTNTPFDVVGWHGVYYPYKYDLGRFNIIGSTSFDHPDASIYTVLSNPTADFVIFPPRWLVQEDTFRPPWYHRNTMSEFMGLIMGDYDAKAGGGFKPAGASLHNVMSAHGPDADTREKASNAELRLSKVGEGSMTFMFESPLMIGVTEWAAEECRKVQWQYNSESWVPLKRHFKPPVA
ncbi:unnamed protein product [Clonostachys rhizophaga]|uniref:homogentisate 1,2-dioxygenase n=1 Tax=Clonostachys rhizophaga TaxID=160324 RepID=A0A9N9V1N7_9HYPO|nr:unnamed protein product [Clonostachys rhizophaga]